jgi:hypothetical protein
MSTTLAPTTDSAPDGPGGGRPRDRVGRRAGLTIVALVIGGIVLGGLVMFSWMINETHFDRPSPQFDEFASSVESLPGVQSVQKERWVEAPTFFEPTSWMSVTVEQSGLPGLLDAACSTEYPDAITWSIIVLTPAASEVSLHAPATGSGVAGQPSRCPDFGFDAVGLVAELDRVAPGLAVQPAIWGDGRLAFVEVAEELPEGFAHLLPLVEHSADLVAAAGVGGNWNFEINSANLGAVLAPGESDAYLSLLTDLADLGVTSYWADGGETPGEGGAKVQIVAPAQHHEAISEAIQSSPLPVADLPIRYIEQ